MRATPSVREPENPPHHQSLHYSIYNAFGGGDFKHGHFDTLLKIPHLPSHPTDFNSFT